ncbi:MAG: hypothetical protein JXR63_00275 [Spirochaetales bacterium]|nr:hypothetical protein [Spirochaetales bacterium]
MSDYDDLDPEIAELMGIQRSVDKENVEQEKKPSFQALFGGAPETEESGAHEVDLKRASFPPITKSYSDQAVSKILLNREFYHNVINFGKDEGIRLHKLLTAFIKTQDNQERSMYRNKMISAYWNFLSNLIPLLDSGSEEILYNVRFGVVAPNLLGKELALLLSRVFVKNETGEPIYYFDEWLKQVAYGNIKPSAVDETRNLGKKSDARVESQISATQASLRAAKDIIKVKMHERDNLEKQIQSLFTNILQHSNSYIDPELEDPYSDAQLEFLSRIQQFIVGLKNIDREIKSGFSELNRHSDKIDKLRVETGVSVEKVSQIDDKTMSAEFDSTKQMAKMCVGRRGNHLPVLMAQYFKADQINLGTRENIIKILTEIEQLDQGLFERRYRQEVYRIVPYIILMPCYGDRGICWEPFDKFNRATSRGRIAVPMYPKDLRVAVISAVADLRWQVAKEKAAHYWMEEGLTGGYYQWSITQKLKGNIKDYFIEDYILWINKESKGIQKLERNVRKVFWRHIPFPQEIKDDLKNRGFVYSELAKKDFNRSISDGY